MKALMNTPRTHHSINARYALIKDLLTMVQSLNPHTITTSSRIKPQIVRAQSLIPTATTIWERERYGENE